MLTRKLPGSQEQQHLFCHRVPKIRVQHDLACPGRAQIYGKEWEKLSSSFLLIRIRVWVFFFLWGGKAELVI